MTEIIHPDAYDMSLLDGDGKLDTGMTVKEVVRRAMWWWESKGSREMRLHHLRQAEPVGGANNGAGASFASLNPDSENFLPSGILHGLPWDELNKDEKLRVCKAWHNEYVRMPQDLTES